MTLADKLSYYGDLLIAQYRTAVRARAQVAITGKQIMVDDLATQLQTAFAVDIAVGAQLDVIGKYVGVARNIAPGNVNSFWGLWTYASTYLQANYQGTWNPTTNSPALPSPTGRTGQWYAIQVGGTAIVPPSVAFNPGDIVYSNGGAWLKATTDNANGLTIYADYMVNANAQCYSYGTAQKNVTNLTDNDYRQVIKFQIIRNVSDHTLASIMAALNTIFPGMIQLIDNKDMTLTYLVSAAFPLSPALLAQFLPRPMAVGITVTIVTPSGSGRLLTETGDSITTESGDHLVLG